MFRGLCIEGVNDLNEIKIDKYINVLSTTINDSYVDAYTQPFL